MRVNASVMRPISVCVVFRNLRRTGVLKNRFRTSIVVPDRARTGLQRLDAAADRLPARRRPRRARRLRLIKREVS